MDYKEEIKTAIDLISISVRTAPKSGGIDDVVFLSANSKQKEKIAKAMINIGKQKAKNKPEFIIRQAIITGWESDAKTVRASQALILIGVKGKRPFGANCGGCGFKSCREFKIHNLKNKNSSIMGPFCIFKIWDLGIATASAAKKASMLDIDNRIMYRIGIACERLKLFAPKKTNILNRISPILGLPLSVSGKNIFFDRLDKLQAAKVLTDYFEKRK